MGKREREIQKEEIICEILDKAKVIHLGLSDGEQPYVIPMNYGYCYENGALVFYMHGAKTGYKYEVIRNNSKASFSIECDVKPFEGKTACQYGVTYKSIAGKGTAELVEDVEEKEKALTVLMKTQTGKAFEFNEKLVSIVNVIKLTVTEYTAKRRPLPGEEAHE